MLKFLGGTALGAALAYLLDPVWGLERRTTVQAFVRRLTGAAAQATGQTAGPPTPDDSLLARKVESLVHRDVGVSSDSVQIRADRGVIELRGFVDTPAVADSLKATAGRVEGVIYIRNLLQVADTPRAAASSPHGVAASAGTRTPVEDSGRAEVEVEEPPAGEDGAATPAEMAQVSGGDSVPATERVGGTGGVEVRSTPD
jgi:osmotically-inducible protein OsmY